MNIHKLAESRARDKLERIISREGDAGGERLKPEYLDKLISEAENEIKVERESICLYRKQALLV